MKSVSARLRRVLQQAAALEVEGTFLAVADWIADLVEVRSARLFELRGRSNDVRELAVWTPDRIERPRGRLALEGDRSEALLEIVQRWPAATLDVLEGYEDLVPGCSSVLAAVLAVEDQVCGMVILAPSTEAPQKGVPDVSEGLLPLGMVLAHSRAEQRVRALQAALDRAQKKTSARERFTDDAPDIIGADHGLAPVMQKVVLVSTSDLPVLLLGETGSGKEVIAREIHVRSSRADGPFVRVNCGAIPPELIDSALFGHERGSFTGASHQHKGWFERAHGGTLFLDEVGELPPAAQVRLLRVLQDGIIERIGALDPIHVDCRIVAATHRDLPGMVEERTFRDDLWFRLSAFPIEIPALRERMEDIGPLARFFAARTARLGVSPCEPTPEDIELLQSYAWPGNVRELAMVIDRAAILGQGRKLQIEAALGAPAPGTARPHARSRAHGQNSVAWNRGVVPSGGAMDAAGEHDPTSGSDEAGAMSLDAAMRSYIESVLTAVKGRIEGPGAAAELLGINPHTLRSRMRKLGIDWSRFRSHERG